MLQRFAVIAVLTLALGCGRGSSIEVSTRVDGPFTEVVVHRLKADDVVTVDGQTLTAKPGNGALTFSVPTNRFEDGKQVEVTRTRAGKTATTRVGAEVTPDDLAPALVLWECTRGDPAAGPAYDDDDRRQTTAVWITSDAWASKATARPRELCTAHADGRARLRVGAHADATLTIGGRSVALADGRAEYELELGALAPALTLAAITDDDQRNHAVAVNLDATVTRGGARRTYRIDVELTHEDVVVALHKAFTSWDGKAPWPWPRPPHDGPARSAALVTRNLEVEVDGAARHSMNGWYAFPLVVGGTARVDELDLVAIATPVDAVNAGSCRYTTIEGTGPVRNVVYQAALAVVVHDATGAEIARRTFPPPKQPACPDALASRDDRTRLLVSTPAPDAILAWLDQVRTAR